MDKEYISQLVDDIFDGNNTDAREKFDDVLSTKISVALDQRKIDLAQSIYNDQPEKETEEAVEQEEESEQ